jgi:hypothetical protein
VVVIFSKSHSTPCRSSIVKTDLAPVITCFCTAAPRGSSPSLLGAKASTI